MPVTDEPSLMHRESTVPVWCSGGAEFQTCSSPLWSKQLLLMRGALCCFVAETDGLRVVAARGCCARICAQRSRNDCLRNRGRRAGGGKRTTLAGAPCRCIRILALRRDPRCLDGRQRTLRADDGEERTNARKTKRTSVMLASVGPSATRGANARRSSIALISCGLRSARDDAALSRLFSCAP